MGTFGFSRKDLKLSEDLTESIESSKPTMGNPWKSVQVTKLDLSTIKDHEAHHYDKH